MALPNARRWTGRSDLLFHLVVKIPLKLGQHLALVMIHQHASPIKIVVEGHRHAARMPSSCPGAKRRCRNLRLMRQRIDKCLAPWIPSPSPNPMRRLSTKFCLRTEPSSGSAPVSSARQSVRMTNIALYNAATATNLSRLKGASFRSKRNATRTIDKLIPNDQSPASRGVIQDRGNEPDCTDDDCRGDRLRQTSDMIESKDTCTAQSERDK
jgi:hypothetical protein